MLRALEEFLVYTFTGQMWGRLLRILQVGVQLFVG